MSPKKRFTFSQACAGFIYYKDATGKSPHTIADYHNSFAKVRLWLASPSAGQAADPPMVDLTRDEMIKFFSWLTNDHISQPGGAAKRPPMKLSPKSILNIHTNLSALWHWAVNESIVPSNIIRTIDPPPVEAPVIVPFTREEIALLLKACDKTRTWQSRESTTSYRHTVDRDRAIVLVLIDTGMRAEELCNLTLGDVNLRTNTLTVRGKGAGRDQAERAVHFGKITTKALWKYLTPRLGQSGLDESARRPLFTLSKSEVERPFNRNALYQFVASLGERAGVADVHPHRFRHSFAITYLRNGGDLFTLQELLGHADMEMVRRYAQIAKSDVEAAYRKASPADNWRL